jgi:hypothetical protein
MAIASLPPRRLVLHVGTHKTGTKALQVFLDANRRQLAETGIHYPLAGRHLLDGGLITPGHHQIAFDLASAPGAPSASLEEVVAEIRLVQAATVVLSSEEFLPLIFTAGALETIVSLGRDLGYEPIAVVVLRAQPDYLESIFSELAKTTPVSAFDDLIDQASRGSSIPRLTFLDLSVSRIRRQSNSSKRSSAQAM